MLFVAEGNHDGAPIQVVCLEGPGQLSLFVCDNDTFVVESSLDEPVDVQVVTGKRFTALTDMLTGRTLAAAPAPQRPWGRMPGKRFPMTLPPHSYRVLQGQQ